MITMVEQPPLEEVFRANMRRLREQRGMTQAEAAEAMGVPQSYYSDLERGRRSPRLSTLDRLAEALQTTPGELLARNVQPAKV